MVTAIINHEGGMKLFNQQPDALFLCPLWILFLLSLVFLRALLNHLLYPVIFKPLERAIICMLNLNSDSHKNGCFFLQSYIFFK